MLQNPNLPEEVVLLVDDQPENLLTLARYLEEAPFKLQLLTARSGDKALEVAHITKPDLVITDWEMPGMDGLAFLKRLKQDTFLKSVPVVMITGVYTAAEDLLQAMQWGATDYLRKPINKIELWARVQNALTIRRSISTIESQNQEIRQQGEQIMDRKNRQLNMKAIEMEQQGGVLRDVENGLQRLSKHASGPVQVGIKELIKQIQQTGRHQQQWSEFRGYFEKTHPTFLSNLEKQFPQLSNQEIRLCSYFKIKMTPYEIAELKHVAPETIRTQKYRIKKKMALPKAQDLTEFLNSLT